MDKSGKVKLHFDTMPKPTLHAFEFLSKERWIGRNGWYLAGGTALALQVGYRRSVDLDFFTQRKKFDNKKLIESIKIQDWKIKRDSEDTIFAELYSASVSFISYPFFVPKSPRLKSGLIDILDAKDIAVMKVIAISQRGKKRDFFDLYYCAKNVLDLDKIVTNLRAQYPLIAHNYQHILKSLVYFADAEDDPEPDLLIDLNWKTVKKYFEKEIPALTKKLLRI